MLKNILKPIIAWASKLANLRCEWVQWLTVGYGLPEHEGMMEVVVAAAAAVRSEEEK